MSWAYAVKFGLRGRRHADEGIFERSIQGEKPAADTKLTRERGGHARHVPAVGRSAPLQHLAVLKHKPGSMVSAAATGEIHLAREGMENERDIPIIDVSLQHN